jgi:hypothetical protein
MASAHRSEYVAQRRLHTLCLRALDDLVQGHLLTVPLEPHGQPHGV